MLFVALLQHLMSARGNSTVSGEVARLSRSIALLHETDADGAVAAAAVPRSTDKLFVNLHNSVILCLYTNI